MLLLCLLGLTVTVSDGGGAVVARDAVSSRRFAVVVKDGGGAAVRNATVTFRLPAEGVTGVFASGMRTESVMTDERGMAYVQGVRWGAAAGTALMRVTARAGEATGEAEIGVEVSASAPAEKAMKAGGGGKKWLILVVAAGAGAGAAMAMGGKGGTAAAVSAPVAVVTAPSIGAPSITVGKP